MATLTTTIKERVRLALADKAAGDVVNAILAQVDDGNGSITVGAIAGGDASLGITAQAAASATSAGGAIALTAAAGGATSGTGGAITATAGAGTAGNANGGAITATAGAAHGTGTGGSVSLAGGASGATNAKGGDIVLTPGTSTGTGAKGIIRAAGVIGRKLSRAIITTGSTITDAETAGGILYQDASGGSVTMTTRTGTQLAAYFSTLATGEAIELFVASNHASNTSTISGGTDVTLVGSGAVTQTGGTFLLVKTAATTFDLVRVG